MIFLINANLEAVLCLSKIFCSLANVMIPNCPSVGITLGKYTVIYFWIQGTSGKEVSKLTLRFGDWVGVAMTEIRGRKEQ